MRIVTSTTDQQAQSLSNRPAQSLSPSTTYLERLALLQKHGFSLSEPCEAKLPELDRFLNGQEAITREDSLKISHFLQTRLKRQDVQLLHAMQKLDKDFIPYLQLFGPNKPDNYFLDEPRRKRFDAEFEQSADQLCAVLDEVTRSGLTFIVEVSVRPMALRVARALHEIMKSPLCKVKGFEFSQYGNYYLGIYSETAPVLAQCIADCSTLEWVRSNPSSVRLVSRGVPTLEITGRWRLADTKAIKKVLERGGTTALHLTAWELQPHVAFTKAVQQGNSKHPAHLSVRSVKLHDKGAIEKPSADDLEQMRQGMEALFGTPHLTQLEIPNVAWLASLDPTHAAALIQNSSLQNLSFERDDVESPEGRQVLDKLWPHLKANRDLAYLPLQRAAAVWSSHLMGQQIDHLANLVAEKLAPSPVDRTIFTNQRQDMRGAAAIKSDRERAIEAKRNEI